jgi:uncharacterized membrane protein
VSLRLDIVPLLLALALASYACRVGGFWLMRFVVVTPRLRATLAAAPLAVMLGIVTPVAMRGGLAEWIGLIATFVAMRLAKSDLIAMFCGIAAVALARLAL